MNQLFDRSYFFDQGIQFECQQCGACCNGSPGFVYVKKNEIFQMALYLNVPVISFIEKYLYPFGGSYSIKEEENGRCLFYRDGCRIYPVRPFQCKTFPFWFDILRSRKKWAKVSKKCPGIGCGRLYPKNEIIEIVGSTVCNFSKTYG